MLSNFLHVFRFLSGYYGLITLFVKAFECPEFLEYLV